MTLLGIILIILLVLAICRKMHQRLEMMKFKNRVFELRDKLRLLAIEGKLDKSSFGFRFFDALFSNAIQDAYFLTLFRFIATGYKSQNPFTANEKFAKEYHKSINSNVDLKQIVEDFYITLISYLMGQHYLTFTLVVNPLFRIFWGANVLHNRLMTFTQRGVVASESPELYLASIPIHKKGGH